MMVGVSIPVNQNMFHIYRMTEGLILLQEHWLREPQFYRMKNIPFDSTTVLSHDVSAIDNNVFTRRRDFGVCSFFVWKSYLKANVISLFCRLKGCVLVAYAWTRVDLSYSIYTPIKYLNNIDITIFQILYTALYKYSMLLPLCEENHKNVRTIAK